MSAAAETDPENETKYRETPVLLDHVPAATAVLTLAGRVAEALGSGSWIEDGRRNDGILDVPVYVTVGGIYGTQRSITIETDGETTVLLDDDTYPLQQLQALLEQLRRHTIASDLRGESGIQ